mgnify:FL=1
MQNTNHIALTCSLALFANAAYVLAAQPASTGLHQPAAKESTISYPTKPVRMVIAAIPGTGPEVVARQLAFRLGEAWGQQVVVDPRPGATGLIGADIVARSAPDGYTLWFATSTQLLGTTLYQRNWMAKEYAPIGMLASTAFSIVVNSAVPANSIAEFITYAKARPGKLLYGSNGQGSTTHLCTELFSRLTGIDMVHVPYEGGTLTLTELASGQIQMSCQPLPSLPVFVKAGRVRVLGVTTAKRSQLAPDVPPIAETIAGFEILGWHGMLAPLKTPKFIIDKVNAEMSKVARSADMQARLLALGVEAAPSTPADFGAFLHAETARWAKVLKDANIRPID